MDFWDKLKESAGSGISAYVDGAVEERFTPATASPSAPAPGVIEPDGMSTKTMLMIGGGVLVAVVVLGMVLRK